MGAAIEPSTEKIATRVAYGKSLVELAKSNQDIVVLDADLSSSTQTKFFAKEFPERFFNMGIAEANMVSTAAGLAKAGKIPFVSSFAMFATGRAWEQVRNSVAHNHANVKICATHAGLTVGEDGASHQIIEDIALMKSIPGMVVIVPADAKETEKVMQAVTAYNGPVYVRLGRSALPVLFDDKYNFQIGKANVIEKGEDLSIMACGIMVSAAVEAAKILKEKHNKSIEIINIASIKPLDTETIVNSALKTRNIIVAEEHNIWGGLGDSVASALLENCSEKLKFKRLGVKDSFGQSGKAEDLLIHYGLTAENLVKLSLEMLDYQP
ncbi:MAG: transketolase family protein [Candidatus Melainabacteria bacterium]|nr:transketolase family protein [Candidatus Melainabacteria bacterium]